VSQKLLKQGHEVLGLDNLNAYYDVKLKERRLALLVRERAFRFVRASLEEADRIDDLFGRERPELVVHLAAQPGIRYSLQNPRAYVDSNVVGFLNVLEGCRRHGVRHLVFASSSSVYGGNTKVPFSVRDNVDHPVSLYAATKKANELMAHSYSHLYGLPTTGLRFFTVYGPWGRPDMALFKFVRQILAGEPIDVFNYGNHRRDFTYIDDIVEGVVRTLFHVPTGDPEWTSDKPDPGSSFAPWRVYNIGNQSPVELMRYIEVIEECLDKTAEKNLLPLQAGDVPDTWADVEALVDDVGYQPATTIEVGVRRFVDWYKDYYDVAG
jgi:UDP-glucuronate 4-epimerase